MIHSIGRFMQLAGLIILPVAIAGNVGEHMPLGSSLTLSAAGITVFFVGWLLQQQTKGKK